MRKRTIHYAKSDFAYSSLPVDRKGMFFDCYRNNFKAIFRCGLFLLLCALPLFASLIALGLGRMGLEASSLSDEEREETALLFDMVSHGAFFVCFFSLLFGACAANRVLRQLVWQEGVDFWYDVGKGIKQDYGFSCLFAAILLVLHVLSYVFLLGYLGNFFAYVPSFIALFAFDPMLPWAMALIGEYQAKFPVYLKNSAFFFFKNVLWSWLFLLLFAWPLVLYYLPFAMTLGRMIVETLVLALLFLFYYPALLMAFRLFADSHFDKTLNQELFPEYYRRGLYGSKKKK